MNAGHWRELSLRCDAASIIEALRLLFFLKRSGLRIALHKIDGTLLSGIALSCICCHPAHFSAADFCMPTEVGIFPFAHVFSPLRKKGRECRPPSTDPHRVIISVAATLRLTWLRLRLRFGSLSTLNRWIAENNPQVVIMALFRIAGLKALLRLGLPMLQHTDFSVVAKNKARLPRPWRWEIYRAGRRTPIGHSDIYFETATEAKQAGQKALNLILSEFPA